MSLRNLILAAIALVSFTNVVHAQRNDDPEAWKWVDATPVKGLVHETLFCVSMQREIGLNVFLPPSYDTKSDVRFPVVYFLHGASGTERSDADFLTAQSLMRQGRIPEAIFVFPNGGQYSRYRDWPDQNVKIESYFIQELIPHIDAKYRTIVDRSARALSGWSMGGDASLRFATKYPDLFCVAATYSAAIDWGADGERDTIGGYCRDNFARIRDRVALKMVVGERDRLIESHRRLLPILDELKIKYQYQSFPDVGHDLGRMKELAGEETLLFIGSHLPQPQDGTPVTEDRTAPTVRPKLKKSSLFNEKDLSGWDADPDYWRVDNGSIIGEIAPGTTLKKNTWLVWNGGRLSDFELNVRFKLTGSEGANSGIQIRCQVENFDHVSGYQADLDNGAVWLGRIYDEHGRALLAERGVRVQIEPDGTKRSDRFAPANQYKVLFRENAWNEYRIVAVGSQIDIYVNGTLFSQLRDEQKGEHDLTGSLAFQLHSGGETRVEFRDIELEVLSVSDVDRLAKFELRPMVAPEPNAQGVPPTDENGKELDLGFEAGNLDNWVATGDAFKNQPVSSDQIAQRWPGQVSNKVGTFFIGGYEHVRDAGTGTLTSSPFKVTKPYASFMLSGGNTKATRVELLTISTTDQPAVFFTAVGDNREQMRRVVADLRSIQGASMAVRLADESGGAWGHLNFDDFRLHDTLPVSIEPDSVWRSTFNPILQHLIPSVVLDDKSQRGSETVAKMYVPHGFSVDVVAAEPQVHQPIAFTFDARGRLWVAEGHSYPQKRADGEGLDRVLIFSDIDGDGKFEDRKVFVEGLNLVSAMEVGYGGVWIGAAPQLLFIPDSDGDDLPDSEPQVLLDGFGFADTHETLNSFMWGPDGWLYGNQGVFNTSSIGRPGATASERLALDAGVWRYHPKRHEFEIFAHGGSNQWGLDYDQHGQIFMTHCRSFWGQGLTTHVMQGGHYWNQINSRYPSFISSQSIPGFPQMKNYLLASARYGHGEGGAGKVGSREVYGGHSHVGTMIYLGDNWPEQYRNHLFTHNLHGHQLNHQVNRREAGGYNTVHAGSDVMFCSDEQFIGVDLQVGPDGAVYMSDWYDPRHCHNPNTELWDRGNGRVYRMKFDATFQAAKVDYQNASEDELLAALLHANDWHARTAQRVIAQHAENERFSAAFRTQLLQLATAHPDPTIRLRGIWTLHAMDAIDEQLIEELLQDDSEYVRAWTIQLACERDPGSNVVTKLVTHAKSEPSLFVRRYLASSIARLPKLAAWSIAEQLASQAENAQDRDLPLLLWHAVAPLIDADLTRGLKLADTTPIRQLNDYVLWYTAKISDDGRDQLAHRLSMATPAEQPRLLKLFSHALTGMRGLATPDAWTRIADAMYDSTDIELRSAAEALGAAFDDPRLFARMRAILNDKNATIQSRQHALTMLASDSSSENLPLLLDALEVPGLSANTLPLLRSYADIAIANRVIAKLPTWDSDTSAAAMELLSSRADWASALLDAVNAGSVEKQLLSAYYVRQMANLGSKSLSQRLAVEWGNVGQSSIELRDEITKTGNMYKSAPLWAYEAQAGSQHFKRLCAACHQPNDADDRLAPKLEGTGSKGIDYVIENVIDPNAVIGRDFQARMVLTTAGQVVTGLIQNETDSAVTLKTATNTITIPKSEIDEITISENSFMPTGLLETLNERERIELFKYLMAL